MPLVVVDTSVALPAVLSPSGLARKFWVLLAYGAVAYRHQHLRLELEALKEQAGPGVELGGLDAVEAMVTRAGDRRAALAELLPYGSPDDWVVAGSTYLFDEFERKVVEVGAKLGRQIDPDQAARMRRQYQAICVTAPPPFDAAAAPELTPDRTDDPIVFSALLVGADLLISDDRHIVPRESGASHAYEHEERSVMAVRLHTVLEHHLDVDWEAIDGSWLAQAYQPPAA